MRKKPPRLAGRPVKDSDPDVEDWMTDMRDHIVNIPTNDERIEIVLDHLTKNAKKETWNRQSDMEKLKSADDILKIIEESFQILLGKKGGNSNNERILTEGLLMV